MKQKSNAIFITAKVVKDPLITEYRIVLLALCGEMVVTFVTKNSIADVA